MKKMFLLFALLGVFSLTVDAQSCPYAEKAAAEKTAMTVSLDDALAADASVQKRVNQESGDVSYVRKNVCSQSGKVSYEDVEFCTKSGKFVNVSPSEGMGEGMTAKTVSGTSAKKGCCASKASCSKGKGGVKGASATAVSAEAEATPAKKACCASKTSCSKSASAGKAANTKLVKAEQE